MSFDEGVILFGVLPAVAVLVLIWGGILVLGIVG